MTTWHAAALLLGMLALAGCGNDSGDPAPEADRKGPTTFRAYAASRPASAAAGVSAAEASEAVGLSRAWAIAAIVGADITNTPNAMTAPALYFGRLQAVAAAAQGDTLSTLASQVTLPTSQGSWAALLQGLSRAIGATPDTVVTGSFMQTATLEGHEDAWAELNLYEVSTANLALEPNLRLEVSSAWSGLWAWPSAAPVRATYTFPNGSRQLIDLVRVQGPVAASDAAAYRALVLALPGQARLVQITPRGAIGGWGSAELQQALLAVSQVAVPSQPGEMFLAAASLGAAQGINDRRGLALAQDPVNANLRGLDGRGGTYVALPDGSASAWIDTTGLRLNGYLSTRFIFSPLNVYSGGGVIVTTLPPFAACQEPAADIAPHFLALLDRNGVLQMLARVGTFTGDPCFGIVPTPAGS